MPTNFYPATNTLRSPPQEGNGVDLIFHTNTESGKTDDISGSSEVNVGFLSGSYEWASLSGTATVETDRAKIRKYYSPGLKAWLGDLGDGKHDGGPEDPRIGLIIVKAKTVQYAVSRKNFITSAIEVAQGVVTGEAPAINKLRHLSEAELTQCKFCSVPLGSGCPWCSVPRAKDCWRRYDIVLTLCYRALVVDCIYPACGHGHDLTGFDENCME